MLKSVLDSSYILECQLDIESGVWNSSFNEALEGRTLEGEAIVYEIDTDSLRVTRRLPQPLLDDEYLEIELGPVLAQFLVDHEFHANLVPTLLRSNHTILWPTWMTLVRLLRLAASSWWSPPRKTAWSRNTQGCCHEWELHPDSCLLTHSRAGWVNQRDQCISAFRSTCDVVCVLSLSANLLKR